jgi:ATP-dependent exoDNAse (exonuclease V) beta subunit
MLATSPTAPPPLTGALPAAIGSVQVAVTALSDFAHCPMLYRWRYELATPATTNASNERPTRAASLDAMTLGTLYHRCMELLNFAQPQANKDLISRVIWEMDLDDAADAVALTSELDDMIAKFSAHDLWGSLASARQIHRELDFILNVGQLTLRGQIDLLYCDAQGQWHIVDYKSDRVATDEQIAQRASNYELQMLAYSLAAQRYLDQPVTDASLYFLRPGRQHTFATDQAKLKTASDTLAKITETLITARRTDQFDRIESAQCGYCQYSTLCSRLLSPQQS